MKAPLDEGQENQLRRGAIQVVAVEDDALFRELIANELAAQGFAVSIYPDAESLLEVPEVAAAADAIVLNWQLPGLSGTELLGELRRRGIDRPVVFLTGRPLVANELRAFAAGALDYIDKARGFGILARRLRIITNDAPGERAQRRLQRYGKLVLNPVESRATWDDADARLTLGEFSLVQLLVERSPRYVTHREIYDHIRYPGFISGSSEQGYRVNVRSAVRRIRAKFCSCDRLFSSIETHRTLGYRWRDDGDNPAAPEAK
jgi:two-component system response regulator ChvI